MFMEPEEERYDETRALTISNFRNLGPLIDGRQHRTRLIINRGLDRNSIGGLVTLIGANNCGKSSVLAALEAWYKDQIGPDDYTDFVSDVREPVLNMTIAGGRYACMAPPLTLDDVLKALCSEKSYEIFLEALSIMERTDPSDHSGMYVSSIVDPLKDSDGNDIRVSSSTLSYEQYRQYIVDGMSFLAIFDPNMYNAVRDTGARHDQIFYTDMCYRVLAEQPELGSRYGRSWSNLLSFMERYPEETMSGIFGNESTSLTKGFENRYGYAISQRVFRHIPHKAKRDDLVCDPYNLTDFIISILRSTGCTKEMLADAYKEGRKSRKELENNINIMLADIANNFSELMNGNGRYDFRVILDSSSVSVELRRGDILLDIDHQSEGFRWLFDFFIVLFGKRVLFPGDIILIDEFGNMLNYSTVGELTETIRKFGKKMGVTFVIATQNPMAVDIRHLDEVRIVSPRNNGGAVINNRFDRTEKDDHDILKPILEGLTVNRNYMRSEDRMTVFVSGFTEYFVLNAFSSELNVRGFPTNVDFLPINGLGGTNAEMSDILMELRRIERKAIVLVNTDEQGDKFFIYSKGIGGITVVNFTEITEDNVMRSVGDLFTPDERERFGIDSGSFDRLACFSQSISDLYDGISGMTKLRFSKLIRNLSKMRR